MGPSSSNPTKQALVSNVLRVLGPTAYRNVLLGFEDVDAILNRHGIVVPFLCLNSYTRTRFGGEPTAGWPAPVTPSAIPTLIIGAPSFAHAEQV